jgi:uncharacterized protein YecT (DUF1311 family)
MFKKILAVGLILLPIADTASAQSEAEMKACVDRSGGVSTEMLKCGKIEIDRWDKRLNAAYQALMHRGSRAERAILQHEQRAWLDHHLKETRRLADDPNNGSLAFIVSQNFELTDISQRTLELEKRVKQEH